MSRPPKYDDPAPVLERAQRLYWRQGWAAPSIRDLEAALDLKAPSIYRRFGDKAGLEVAVLDHYLERIVTRRIDRYLPGGGDPAENLRRFLLSAVEERSEEHPPGCLLVMAGGAAADRPHLVPGLGRGLALLEVGLSREAGRLAGLGRIGPAATVDIVDRLLVGFVGLMGLARAGEPPTVLRRRAMALLEGLG